MNLPLTYKDLCFTGNERASNFYYRNRDLCDAAMFVGVMLIVGLCLFGLAHAKH